jgi:YidC/Oxa1 family membrane protein insertase
MANNQNPINKQQLFLLATMMMVVIGMQYYMGGQKRQDKQAPPPNATAMLQKADKAVADKRFQDAINAYRDISGKFGNTQDGATASLRMAQAMRDATGTHRTWTGKQAPNRDEYGATEAYKSLISQYGATKYPEVEQATRELLALRIKMDRAESKHWMYAMLDGMVGFGRRIHLGPYSYAFALLLITIIVKLLTWKLSVQQYKGMRDMQRVQPIVKEIQQKYKGDPKAMNAKVMEAYKEHGVNPLMGCLPLLIQMPIMYVIWFAIRRYEFQFQNGTFLWINGYMHAHHGTITLFGHTFPFIGANLAQPDIPLVILYAISMFVTQRLTVVDPTQAEQQKIMSIMMPLMLAFFFWKFASAFLLYWLMLNIVMTVHQYHVMKAHVQAPVVVESTTGPSSARKRRRRR